VRDALRWKNACLCAKRRKKRVSVLSRTAQERLATADANVFWFFFSKKRSSQTNETWQ
jgi:hypothetical protein